MISRMWLWNYSFIRILWYKFNDIVCSISRTLLKYSFAWISFFKVNYIFTFTFSGHVLLIRFLPAPLKNIIILQLKEDKYCGDGFLEKAKAWLKHSPDKYSKVENMINTCKPEGKYWLMSLPQWHWNLLLHFAYIAEFELCSHLKAVSRLEDYLCTIIEMNSDQSVGSQASDSMFR